jgi:hypothetical protein
LFVKAIVNSLAMEAGMEQSIDPLIAPNMLLNNLRHIFNLDAAIPHHVGQNPYRSPQVTLALALAALDCTFCHRGYKRCQQRLRSLGLTVPMLADPDLARFSGMLTTFQTLCLGRRF